MHGSPMDTTVARALDSEIGARTAREFLARTLAWEHRLRSLRDAAAGTTTASTERATQAA